MARNQIAGNTGNTAEVNSDGSLNVSLTGSYKGYSNEAKPVINNPVEGVVYSYLELDTKGIYILHGGQWVRFV